MAFDIPGLSSWATFPPIESLWREYLPPAATLADVADWLDSVLRLLDSIAESPPGEEWEDDHSPIVPDRGAWEAREAMIHVHHWLDRNRVFGEDRPPWPPGNILGDWKYCHHEAALLLAFLRRKASEAAPEAQPEPKTAAPPLLLHPVNPDAVLTELVGLKGLIACGRDCDPEFSRDEAALHLKRLWALLPPDPDLADGIGVSLARDLAAYVGELAEALESAGDSPELFVLADARYLRMTNDLIRRVAPPRPDDEPAAPPVEAPPAEPREAQPAGKVTKPGDNAFRAYWALRAGKTQLEVAGMMGVHQGTIAKWKAAVERWQAAGNAMPKIDAPPRAARPEPTDPALLDLGQRVDHRPPHQRLRKSDEE